jgi:putative DNA primase/helicase
MINSKVNQTDSQDKIFSDEDFLLPSGYVQFQDGNLYRDTGKMKDGEIVYAFVCNYVPHIETMYFNEQENTMLWTIRWNEDGEIKRIKLVPKDTFSTNRKITELYGLGFSVTSSNASEMVAYFQRYEAMYKNEVEQKTALDQLGYTKGGFLLPNDFISSDNAQDIVFQVSGGDIDYIKGFAQRGTVEQWLVNVFEPIKSRNKVLAFVLASIGSPLLQFFKAPSFFANIGGGSTGGKTATLRASASVWGKWSIAMEFDTTKAGVERRAALLNHFPLLIDDSSNTSLKPHQIAEIIYSLASGKEKTRSGKVANHRVKEWNNITLTTGEQQITDYTKSNGTVARVLSITGPAIEYNPELIEDIEHNTQEYYGTVGPAFLNWFVNLDTEMLDVYKSLLREYGVKYRKTTKNVIMQRIAKYMGFIRLIADMMQHAFNIKINTDLLDELWLEIVNETQDTNANRPLQALQEMISYARINPESFPKSEFSNSYKILGELREHQQLLCFVPSVIDELLEKKGYDPNTIKRQWKEKGYIKTDTDTPSRRTFKCKSIYHKKILNFIAINYLHEDLEGAE